MSKKKPVLPDLTELNDAEHLARIEAGELRFYMVVNHRGLFFRAKGYDGYGTTWVEKAQQGRTR
jgi:hypothetical protein